MTVRIALLVTLVVVAPAPAQSERPKPPGVKNRQWIQIPLDAFFLAKLESAEIPPNVEASKVELIERATRRLANRSATKEEQAAFVASKDKRAYEKLVDRLIETPEFRQHFLAVSRVVKKGDRDSARAAATRTWALMFGQPLGDHPEALQWLAWELADPTLANCCDLDNLPEPWQVKHLARAIAISAVFRQGATNAAAAKRDPDNRLFSRGPAIQ